MLNRNRILGATVLAIVCLALVACFGPARITYHRWRFDVANEYMTNGPSEIDSNGFVSIDVTDVAPAHEYHMNRLVELDEIAKVEYELTNIRNDSGDRSTFAKQLVAGDCPPALYWMSDAPSDATPMVLEVWCEHGDKPDWVSFLQRRNELAAEKPEP